MDEGDGMADWTWRAASLCVHVTWLDAHGAAAPIASSLGVSPQCSRLASERIVGVRIFFNGLPIDTNHVFVFHAEVTCKKASSPSTEI